MSHRQDANIPRETVVRDTAQFAESLAPAVSPATGPRAEDLRADCPEDFHFFLTCAEEIDLTPAVLFMAGGALRVVLTEEPRPDRKTRSLKNSYRSLKFEDSLKTAAVRKTPCCYGGKCGALLQL